MLWDSSILELVHPQRNREVTESGDVQSDVNEKREEMKLSMSGGECVINFTITFQGPYIITLLIPPSIPVRQVCLVIPFCR